MVGNRCGVAVSRRGSLDRPVPTPLGVRWYADPIHLHPAGIGTMRLAAQDLLKIPHGVP